MPYPAELACVVCLAETQRKKASFLREKPERLAFISKTAYPLWLTQLGDVSVLVNGLTASAHPFRFEKPAKTAAFIEALRSISGSPQKFVEALENQARTAAQSFTVQMSEAFPGLVDDRELLTFLEAYFRAGDLKEQALTSPAIPADLDGDAAVQTAKALSNCLRTLQADAKGLQNALAVLKEEAEFHKNAANNEIAFLKEKSEREIATLKPSVDKNVKKLTQKADKALASLQKGADRRTAALTKRRESYLRRLQSAEQKRDAVQRRIDASKKRKNPSKSSSGNFALKKYERDIDGFKKEVKALTDEMEQLRRESAEAFKRKEEEFNRAIFQEQAKITQIQTAYDAKIATQQKQINTINLQTAALNTSLESHVDELIRRAASLKSQVQVDWQLEDESPMLVELPVYVLKYVKGNEEERYALVTPIALSQEMGVFKELKNIFSLSPDPKLKGLIHPANKTLQDTLSGQVLDRLQADADFRIRLNAVCRASNLMDQNLFAQTLNEGLDEIERRGYMKRDEAADLCKRVMGETA